MRFVRAKVSQRKNRRRVQRMLDEAYLEGHGDLVSRLIGGITRVTIWVVSRLIKGDS